MASYVKKPIVVEAIKNTGDSFDEETEWLEEAIKSGVLIKCELPFNKGTYIVKTLEGMMLCEPGAYLIRGVKGELYPCRGDIFEETYEEVIYDEHDRLRCCEIH